MKLAFVPLVLLLAAACVSGGSGPTTTCTSGDTTCLQGTVALQGFTATPTQLQVSLYREFPAAGTTPLSTIPIAAGGSWAFGNLDPWAHYFVAVAADFGQSQDVGAFVGPLTVPSTGGPVAVQLVPAQLTVTEEAPSGMPQQLQSATAFVFDPASGAPVEGATVSILVGGTAVPMPWSTIPGSSTSGYYASFSTPTAAQLTYTITSSAPGAAAPSTWQLVAGATTFSPALTAPATNATIPANQPLTVSWATQPLADEELVQLYTQASGAWADAYALPAPLDEDATSATIPGTYVGPSGEALLVNVAFVQASCPATASGCVFGEVIAAAQVTAQ